MRLVQRSETVLGLHPKACHCATRSRARVVAERRTNLGVMGVPVLSMRARWTQCAGCWRRTATPRLAAPTLVTITLALALLSGLGILSLTHPYVFAPLAGLWGLWMLQHGIDRARDRRLVAAPRTARPTPAQRRRPTKGVVWDDDVVWDEDIVWDDAGRGHVVPPQRRSPARGRRRPAPDARAPAAPGDASP